MTGYRTAEEINRRMVVMAVVMSTFCVVVGLLHTQIQRSAIQILGGGGGGQHANQRA